MRVARYDAEIAELTDWGNIPRPAVPDTTAAAGAGRAWGLRVRRFTRNG